MAAMTMDYERHSVSPGRLHDFSTPYTFLSRFREGHFRNDIILVSAFTLYMTVCTIFYSYYENWRPSVALSFVVDTMTTVGFGYHVPKDDNSRLFTTFVMIVGVSVIFAGISTAMTSRLSYFKSKLSINDLDRAQEIHNSLVKRMGINLLAVFAGLFVVTSIFCWLEDWTVITSLYFAVQTATSVGYGDIPLHQNGTHVIVGLYEFFSVILLTFAISNLTDLHHERKRLAKMLQIAERKQMLSHIEELDRGSGVGEAEFVLAVLEQLGALDRANDIEPWLKKFRQFDVDGTGMLRKEEIAQFTAAEGNLGREQAAKIKHLQATPLGSFDMHSAMDVLTGRNRRHAASDELKAHEVPSPIVGMDDA